MTISEQLKEQAMAQVASLRDGIAARINDLSQRWAENTIALGREFKRARDSFPANSSGQRAGWHEWIEKNTPWSHRHAGRFVRIAEKCGGHASSTKLSINVLELLSRDDTPERAIKETLRIAKGGEVGLRDAKEIVEKHREYPKPKEANAKAKETGKAVLASDGNYYFGASKEEAEAYERKKAIVYSVRRAVEALANVGMKPGAFLRYAEKHQLWRLDEEHLLTDARDWLDELLTEWESR